ncbi:MAG: tetratricopeptide repeat protein [bacterium]
MKEIKIYKIPISIIVVILLLPVLLFADEKAELFRQGNQFYRAEEFSRALESYLEIYEKGFESGPLYYNIGNCYYKLNETGKAILFYEKAKKLMPGDEELEFNLKLANLSVVDKIEPLPTFILFRVFEGFVHLIPKSFLLWLTALLYLFCLSFLIIRILSRNQFLRRICGRISILFLILLIVFGFSLVKQIREQSEQDEAVIMAGEIFVRGAPSEAATILFDLHEGTTVHIDKISGDWYEIVLADGKVGWVEKGSLEII